VKEINQELLFNLIKKLESGEIRFLIAGKECILKASGVKAVKIGEIKEVGNDKALFAVGYDENCQANWNKQFKENFYKEKNLDNCWYKDCSNKIYQQERDYKAVNIPCKDKHKRYICLECYGNKY
jgi:hypothetical protein